VNADECPWRFHENGGATWGIKGQENVIIDGEEKECFTLIGSIDANGQIIPPIFLGAGKTPVVDRHW